MKINGHILTGIGASIWLLIVILDTKTALTGAVEGLELSAKVVIPSLFPFLVLSYLIGKSFAGVHFPFLTPFNRLLGIPQGAESIYLLGFVGGYPVGAKSIENAYREGNLDIMDARRMMGFSSNAGPAFIFGMAGKLFATQGPLWALWGIHIASSALVACILPKHTIGACIMQSKKSISIPEAVNCSIKTMGLICGWVILFRVLIAYMRRWLLWLLPPAAQVALIGFLELTNGCICLSDLTSAGLRFVLCATFLSFGGLCVAMQTVSVTATLGSGMYFPGKILQCALSFLLALVTQYLFFDMREIFVVPTPLLLIILLILFAELMLLYRSKKVVAIPI